MNTPREGADGVLDYLFIGPSSLWSRAVILRAHTFFSSELYIFSHGHDSRGTAV
jgi:hypothetical protein